MLTPHLHEHLFTLIFHKDPTTQQQGIELVRAMSRPDREVVVAAILSTGAPRSWQIAACCLLDRAEALRRMRLFAARCALRRLEQLRAAGQEPDEYAWQLQEAAEALAAGAAEEGNDALEGLRRGSEDYTREWGWFDDYGPAHSCEDWLINSALFRFDDVPEGWEPDMPGGIRVTEASLLRVDPWALNVEDVLEQDWEALQAAACAIVPWSWGPVHGDAHHPDPITAPASRAEAAWQRTAWEAIMREDRDPVEMVWW